MRMGFIIFGILLFEAVYGQNTNEEEAKEFLASYDVQYGILLNLATKASWNYETNITDDNADKAGDAWAELDKYNAEAFINASQFDATDFTFDTKRQLSKVSFNNHHQNHHHHQHHYHHQ